MIRSRGTILATASSSTGVDDVFEIEDIPSPLEVSTISDVDALHHMASYLGSSLLGLY